MKKIGCIPIIAQNYIKYDRLIEVVNYAFTGSDAITCDIFIDLYSVLLPLYGNYDPSLDESTTDIASTIINMIAHYRRFFWYKYRTNTRFILVYSDNLGKFNKMYYPEYNAKFSNKIISKKYINDIIKENLNIVSMIVPYLNNVCYFETKEFDTSTMIYHVINTIEKEGNIPNIIITKDSSVWQIIGATSGNDTSDSIVFRPKKVNSEDVSYPITKNNLYSVYSVKISKSPYPNAAILSPAHYSMILAMSKCEDRNMKSILNTNTVFNTLVDLVRKNMIYTGYIPNINEIIELFPEKQKMSLYKSNVESRFKAIDCIYQSGVLINNMERVKFKGFMNLYDPNGLHEIASTYFKNNPLNLEYI